MSLSTDKFFWLALNGDDDLGDELDGRIFNTGRDEMDEEEDILPYVIITNEGTQNQDVSKDDEGESDVDTDTVSVLVCARSRGALAELTEKVRSVIRGKYSDMDADDMTDELGFVIDGYAFSAGAVNYDWTKPCYYQTLTYVCDTINIEEEDDNE